ncbi:MAG: PepSY domain-containing protein [Opitutaceae bacterium]|nr:PepSY domain-containing protein [Opitutaceae bacterium]
MITFDRLNRRTHLYLGLILVPWVLMYGLSSLIISHQSWFRSETPPPWQPLFERPYQRAIPADGDVRDVARAILRENNLDGAFYVQRPNPGELRIMRQTFFDITRVVYTIDEGKLRADRQQVAWHQVLVRLHFRGGFEQPHFLNQLWGFVVDLTCVAILLWIATGLTMWWRLARLRISGSIALGAGLASFLLLVWKL